MNWRNLRPWARKATAIQLDRFENENVELLKRKKDLENDIARLSLEIQYLRDAFEMEKARLVAEIDRTKVQAEFDLKLREKEILTQKSLEIQKLKSESEILVKAEALKVAQDYDAKLLEMKKHLLAEKEEWMKKNYQTLQESMTRLHEQGNHSTKFVQEIALKMLDKSPDVNRLNIDTTGNPPKRYQIESD